jgi:hypothetical protein
MAPSAADSANMEVMTGIHKLADRVLHPERYPRGPRPASGFGGAVTARLQRSQREAENLAAGLLENYLLEHPEAAEHPPTPEVVEQLAAQALGGLISRREARKLAEGFMATQEQEGTP